MIEIFIYSLLYHEVVLVDLLAGIFLTWRVKDHFSSFLNVLFNTNNAVFKFSDNSTIIGQIGGGDKSGRLKIWQSGATTMTSLSKSGRL